MRILRAVYSVIITVIVPLFLCCTSLLEAEPLPANLLSLKDLQADYPISSGGMERQHVVLKRAPMSKEKQVQQKKYQKLLEFCHELFEDDIISLDDHDLPSVHYVSLFEIRKRFGEPIKTERVARPYFDPGPTDPPDYYEITWHFEGLRFTMSEHLHLKNNIFLSAVVTSPAYPLKHGLRVGQDASHFIDVLGVPTEQEQNLLVYNITDPRSPQYEISVGFDKGHKVMSVWWALGGDD